MLTYLFPGQGSQCLGMGKGLFELFKSYTQQADEQLGYSIEELCTQDPEKRLNNTKYTQPALYVVNVLTYLKHLEDTQQHPDYVAGHSLGEYCALFVAGVFDFVTGLTLVQKRGELMSQMQGGGMAAIIGLELETIHQILQEHQLSNVSIANDNSYQQFVISGPKADIIRAQSIFENKATCIQLNVSGAFHSPLMTSAQQLFAEWIEPFEFSTPTLPVMANIDAAPYHPAIIKRNLTHQISHPVKWTKIIEYLHHKPGMTFQEIGPGHVLKGLLQRITQKK